MLISFCRFEAQKKAGSMASGPLASPRLLIADDDSDLLDILHSFLSEEGYIVSSASSLQAALAILAKQAFLLILTDLFSTSAKDPLSSALPVLERSRPTPVILMTGWNVSLAEAQQRGFHNLISKPFDLNTLATEIAASLNRPLTALQQRQAAVVERYFDAVTQHDIDTVLSLCTDDVTYYPPMPLTAFPHARPAFGKADYRAYLEQALRFFAQMEVDALFCYAHPNGLAVRYAWHWTAPDGSQQQTAVHLLFQFEGERISLMGRDFSSERLHELPEQQADQGDAQA